MIIKSVEVKNFRSIREERLDCDNLTAIVGRNGAGKSSFLCAIDTFYDTKAPITKEDFFNRDMSNPIEICVTYGDLRDDEKEEFQSYIRDDKLIITKRISSENDSITPRYYASVLQIPQFAEIRAKSGKRDRINAWNELVDSGELTNLSEKARSADDVEQLMSEYEANHPELMKPIEREKQFFGDRNIGGGKLDKFTKYVLIPAVCEASDEANGKKGAIHQILDMVVLSKINDRDDIQEFRSEFEERVRKLYSPENLTELSELGTSISETLERFAPSSKLNLQWNQVEIPEVLPTAKVSLMEDNFEGEINRKGHGLQRALILSLLQHLAVATSTEPTTEGIVEEGIIVPASGVSDSRQVPDLILAIEEPELYLHPSRCRYLSDLLLKLARKQEGGLGARNQVLYTTHSPHFVDLHRFDQIRIVRKESSPDSTAPYSVVKSFSLEKAKKKLAKMDNANPDIFTIDGLIARTMPIMNSIVNEGFFADVVVVVEGLSDLGALWKLQEIMNKDWSQLGIVVVPAGGKNNIDRPAVIFRGLSIPTYFVFDADSQLTGKEEKKEAKNRNHRYLKLADVPIEDFPDTQVHEKWAVFKTNLEGIFKETLGDKIFQMIQKEVASELGYDDCKRACKNIMGSARFIELAYEKGYKIPKLEEIIEEVTQLRIDEK